MASNRQKPYLYRKPPKVVDQGLDAAGNPAGAGNGNHKGGGGADTSTVPKKEQSQESKYSSTDPKKKKKKKAEAQCPIHEQNKAGIDELPDRSEFIYNLETKTAKKALKRVWKNPE